MVADFFFKAAGEPSECLRKYGELVGVDWGELSNGGVLKEYLV